MPRWAPELEAVTAFAITCFFYLLGASDSLDGDSSITVAHFVATPSLLDPFRRVYVLNNHPLFSFVDHVVYSLGGQSEFALRVLPITFGAATIALLAWWCARHWGVLAGAAAAIVTASNPLFASESRSVRGYSLLTLCALISTLVFVRLLKKTTKLLEVAYVLSLPIGIGTHLYGLLVIPPQAAVVLAHRRFSRRWLARWGLALILGALPYAEMARHIWAYHGYHRFSPSFPLELARDLFGTHAIAITATLLLMAIAVMVIWPPQRPVVWATATVVVMVAGIWLVVQPVWLVQRFFMWLIPGVGFLAALAVGRRRIAFLLAVACLVSTAVYEAGSWTEDPFPTRAAARLLSAAAAHGLQPCVQLNVGPALAAYSPPPFRTVNSSSQLTGCGVVLEWPGLGAGPTSRVRGQWPYRTVLTAQSVFAVYSKIPLPRQWGGPA